MKPWPSGVNKCYLPAREVLWLVKALAISTGGSKQLVREKLQSPSLFTQQ